MPACAPTASLNEMGTVREHAAAVAIHYSRGTSKIDNAPVQCVANNFDEFETTVLADRAPKKGLTFICAPLGRGVHYQRPHDFPGENHWRLKNYAEPRQYLPFDFDGFADAATFAAAFKYLSCYRGFGYTTASHTAEAPRARAILLLSRPVSRDEGIVLGGLLQAEMVSEVGADAIKFDESVYRGEQPIYTPVTSSETFRFSGDAVDVDTVLASKPLPTPAIPPIPRASSLTAALAGITFVIPDNINDGEGRESFLLAYASHLRSIGMEQETIERTLLDYNSERINPPLNAEVVLDKARRYKVETAQQLGLAATGSNWPDPKPIAAPLPAVKPFNTKLLPVAFQAFVEDQADLMQIAPDFIGAPLMVAAAAAIGNGLVIAPKREDTGWLVPPTIWGGVVGRPGVLKSPAIDKATRPLSALELEMQVAFEQRKAQYKLDLIMYESAMKKARSAASQGQSVAPVAEPIEPKPERIVVNDSTSQMLGEILRHSPRGVLVLRDELVSLLETLAAEGQEGSRGFYLESWNGLNPYRVDRVGRGSFMIPRLALWVFGGIQPGRLQAYIRQAVNGGNGDDGLLQRFQLLVWPDTSKEWKQVDRKPDWAATQSVEETFRKLRHLDPVAIGANVDALGKRPAYLQFTSEAQALFNAFRLDLETALRIEGRHPALESHLSKYRSLVPALALVLHLADGGTGPVCHGSLTKAIEWNYYLWSHARRVYASVTNAAAFGAKALADKITAGKLADGFTARDVRRNGWQSLGNVDDVRAALDWLIDAGWLRETRTTNDGGGRPTEVFTINPRVQRK